MAGARCPSMANGRSERATLRVKRDGTASRLGRGGAVNLGQAALILGVAALALGGSGLAIALTNAGHTGAAGATGPRGVAGPGAVTSSNFDLAVTNLSYATCTRDIDSNFSFVVSGPGTVVLTATVVIFVQHTIGQSTNYYVGLENASRACAVSFDSFGAITSTSPTGAYYPDVSVVVEYTLGAPGTYTYAINAEAINSSAADATQIYEASEVGTFYPT